MVNIFLLDGQFMWNIPLLVSFLAIAILYSLMVHHLTEIKMYHKQPLYFFFSIGLLYLTIGSPLTTISHLSFSLHMIQMSILYFVIPPMLLLAIPGNLFNRIKKFTIIDKLSKWTLSPRVALIVFSILFFMYHLPFLLKIFSLDSYIHNGYMLLLFLLSLYMWWPLVSPDPKKRFSERRKKRYVVLSGVLLMPACLFFIFSAFIDGINNPFLAQITAHLCIPSQSISFNILPPPFNTKYDQVMAGFIMFGMHKIALRVSSQNRREGTDAQVKKFG
ncbi:cytochrome c oxidase assembly protein [Cytobacillus praedii]|uniref:cytochrome c oxidase assembly protein n=1 Tax=Cytobacillus praedii TaxID=1742358 RepID=UPI00070B8EED|nr:cytochrome c oxidase assembly protein [Cytobacillus praedii]